MLPTLLFKIGELASVTFQDGYIAWSDPRNICDNDAILNANLRKAHKLYLKVLYPYNNQNVSLALAVFDESAIAAAKNLFPSRKNASSFLALIKI